MMAHVSPRDRTLVVSVLIPVALILTAAWVLAPLSASLASARGRAMEREVELLRIHSLLSRRAELESYHAAIVAEHRRLSRLVHPPERASEATLAVQTMLQGAGVDVRSVRVENLESVESGKRSRLRVLPIEVSVNTNYSGLRRLVSIWSTAGLSVKLARVEARADENRALQVKLLGKVFVRP